MGIYIQTCIISTSIKQPTAFNWQYFMILDVHVNSKQTCIKQPPTFIFTLSFDWLVNTGLTVLLQFRNIKQMCLMNLYTKYRKLKIWFHFT